METQPDNNIIVKKPRRQNKKTPEYIRQIINNMITLRS